MAVWTAALVVWWRMFWRKGNRFSPMICYLTTKSWTKKTVNRSWMMKSMWLSRRTIWQRATICISSEIQRPTGQRHLRAHRTGLIMRRSWVNWRGSISITSMLKRKRRAEQGLFLVVCSKSWGLSNRNLASIKLVPMLKTLACMINLDSAAHLIGISTSTQQILGRRL